jgi:sugar lactone lactonase YvrE
VSVVELTAEPLFKVRARLGEGPVWDERDGSLVFVDIDGAAVHRFRLADGRHTSFSTGVHVGAVGLRAEGGLVLALLDHFAFTDEQGSDLERVPGFTSDAAAVRFNDGEVDPWGRFVAGTMAWSLAAPLGSLYQLSPDGSVSSLVKGVTCSNGLAWTDDRTRLYYVDTPTQRIDAFDVDPDTGALLGRGSAIEVPAAHGSPDGLTLDAEGCIWLACYGGSRVCRYTPAGVLDRLVRLPASLVTSVAFGGPDLDQLYITTASAGLDAGRLAAEPFAGDLFVAHPRVQGRPTNRFG